MKKFDTEEDFDSWIMEQNNRFDIGLEKGKEKYKERKNDDNTANIDKFDTEYDYNCLSDNKPFYKADRKTT